MPESSNWTGWQPLMASLLICAALVLVLSLGAFWLCRRRQLRVREIQDAPTPSHNRTPDVSNDSSVELNLDDVLDGRLNGHKKPWWLISGRQNKDDSSV